MTATRYALTIGALLLALPAYGQTEKGGVVSEIIETITAGQKLAEAEKVTPQADAHGVALYGKYLELSRVEYDEGDKKDSDVFATRAIAAAQGQRFEPEAIAARELPADELNDAANQRRRLVVAQSAGARDVMPTESAEAQAAFDCWMQEQEENFQFDDIAACRKRFDFAMAAIEKAIAARQPKERVSIEVFFDLDRSEITEEAMANIEAFVETVSKFTDPIIISVIGNADQSGKTDYNVELSKRRADAVAAELAKRGITVDGVFARGDQVPAVDHVDRAPDRLNRRVIMVVRAK